MQLFLLICKAFSNIWKSKVPQNACLQLLYTDNINVWLYMDVQKSKPTQTKTDIKQTKNPKTKQKTKQKQN